MDVVALFDVPDIGYSRQFASIPCLGGCGALGDGWQWLSHCFQAGVCTQKILAKPSASSKGGIRTSAAAKKQLNTL